MKKKIFVPTIVFLLHLLICALLSFDWSFLEGMYMGFGPTFLIVWGLTLPIIIACISIVWVIIQAKKEISLLEIITAVVSGIILLIYLASACGLLKYFELEFIYVFVFIGTFFILGCWCYKKIKKK